MIKRGQPRSDFLRFKGSPSVLGKKLFPYAIIIEVEKFRFEVAYIIIVREEREWNI